MPFYFVVIYCGVRLNAYNLRCTGHSMFIFSADRLIRLVVEEGLNHLPTLDYPVLTPDNEPFDGIKFARGNCAIALSRSGEAMEFAVRQCCR